MSLRCSEVRLSFDGQATDVVWSGLLRQTQMLRPFWILATNTWAERLGTPADKLIAHSDTIHVAFEWMAEWRAQRVKALKKNEKKVSSAISYLRNGALNREVSDLLMSPVARNLAGSVRMCLHLATYNYEDNQIPTIVACEVFQLAAVRTLFPVDLGNLSRYAPDSIHAEGGDIDNFNAMLEAGARHLGLEKELSELNAEAKRLVSEFNDPRPMDLPTGLEGRLGGGRNAKLYFQAQQEFHGRP